MLTCSNLVLTGGNSFFAARFGFVCDNVENFEIVLASGGIFNANANANTDLWTALKGGSSNFGIVTRFDITAFESPVNIWGGVVLYPASTIPAQITALVDFTNAVESDPYASLITFWTYTTARQSTVVYNSYVYTKAISTSPPPFTKHLAITPQILNTLRSTNLTDLTTELEPPSNKRDLFATLTLVNNAALLAEIYAISQRLLSPLKSTPGMRWSIMFQPLPAVITKHSIARGGNVLGLPTTSNNILFLFFVQWDEAGDDAALNRAARELVAQVTRLTHRERMQVPWVYLNYALPEQDVLYGYGRENWEKIRAASLKYDPQQVFQRLVGEGWKWGESRWSRL